MINFVKTTSTEPTKQYELYLSHIPTGIFFPTQELYDFVCANKMTVHANMTTMRGLDLETEAVREMAEKLAEMFPPYGVNMGMTRLEISVALGAGKVKV